MSGGARRRRLNSRNIFRFSRRTGSFRNSPFQYRAYPNHHLQMFYASLNDKAPTHSGPSRWRQTHTQARSERRAAARLRRARAARLDRRRQMSRRPRRRRPQDWHICNRQQAFSASWPRRSRARHARAGGTCVSIFFARENGSASEPLSGAGRMNGPTSNLLQICRRFEPRRKNGHRVIPLFDGAPL